MKKKLALLCVFSLLLVLANLPLASHAASIRSELKDLYAAGNYSAIAKLLEKRIDEIESDSAAGSSKAQIKKLYELHMMLAHVCAWQLDRFNDGLAEYEKAIELRREHEQASAQKKPGPNITSPTIEYLFIAGMYEQIKDYTKALEYYRKILPEIKSYKDALVKNGEQSFPGKDLTYLVQYAIDTIQLKTSTAKTYTPLAKKIDLMHECNPMVLGFMLVAVFPDQEYMVEKKKFVLENGSFDVETFIKSNPTNMYSMLAEALLLMSGLGALEYDKTNQIPRAAEAFINKYPDSYLALSNRFMLAQIAQQKGDTAQAQLHLADLKRTAKKRNIELIIEADKKFATPESTWESLRTAMSKGDVEAALACHIPGDPRYRETYNKFGPEILKKIGADMKPVEKIRSDEQTAKYRTTRFHKKADTEITYYVYFVKIYNEWKIENY